MACRFGFLPGKEPCYPAKKIQKTKILTYMLAMSDREPNPGF